MSPKRAQLKAKTPPLQKNIFFSLTLSFQYLNEFLSSGNDQGMEKVLKVSNFSKFLKKGLGAPTTHPNLQMKTLKLVTHRREWEG